MSALIFFAGCATVDLPNVGENGYSVADDERRIFKRADELIELIDDGDYVYDDPGLEAYLNRLAERLVLARARDGSKISVRVLNDPTLNAFAFPNGRIYVTIGVLAAADNEAQLASIVGHEITHVINRHSLKQFRLVTNKSAFFTVLNSVLIIGAGDLGSIVTQLGAVSSITGFSQQLELEADELGYEMLVQAGYDAGEAPKLFEHLKEFLDLEEIKEPFFFSTHPKVQARIVNYHDLLAKSGFQKRPQLILNTPDFEGFRRRLVLRQMDLCLAKGFFKSSEKTVKGFQSVFPGDAAGQFYMGELYRQRQDHERKIKERDKGDDYPQALAAYDQALALNPQYAEAARGKARVLDKMGRRQEAKESFRKYLELNPDAPDKAYIEQYLTTPTP